MLYSIYFPQKNLVVCVEGSNFALAFGKQARWWSQASGLNDKIS